MRYLIACLLTAVVGASSLPIAAAAEPVKTDWSAWKRIPVYHRGRIMPMDTFARTAVEVICDRTRPTLGLEGNMPASELATSRYAAARELFPDGKPRRFDAAELLYSWLVNPEKWEDVPFLIAEHDELRSKYLDVPVTNEEGRHLKYVSPRQVENASEFQQRLIELRDMKIAADAKGEEFHAAGVDAKVEELWRAYALYRQLTFTPALDGAARRKFQNALQAVGSTWFAMESDLAMFRQADDKSGLSAPLGRASAAIQQLAEMFGEPRLELAKAEPPVAELADATAEIARRFADLRRRLDQGGPELDAEQLEKFRATLDTMAAGTRQLAEEADRLHVALYENENPLRVVPALNARALERDRDPSDDAQPWLDLATLLFGSERPLRGYPESDVEAVRNNFRRAALAYQEGRPNDFAVAMEQFAGALRTLGERIEPVRRELDIQRRDNEMIAYTAYPAANFTSTEVHYNHLDPFKWSWIISLTAAICYSLSFGVMRKPLFWLATAILIGSLGWSIYGFVLRVMITGWAPVTNMYETVVYVPFVVSALGAWFLLLPVTWAGLKNAWRMTAMPGTWERTALSEEQLRVLPAGGWNMSTWLLVLPRLGLTWLVFYALALAPYAAGDRTIINLLPVIDVGQTWPDLNDLMTWMVGLAVLAPTVWYVPRLVLAGLLGAGVIPWTLSRTTERNANVYEHVYARWPFGIAATFVAFFGSFTAWYSPVLDESFGPLQPVLRDNFWLLIHVLTIVSSYGAGALAWGLGNLALGYYLFGRYREPGPPPRVPAGYRPADGGAEVAVAGRRPPEACAALAGYIYKAVQVAVLLLAAGTILGGLWADVAWGRFWGWDPKEVWALISCLVYLAILHARYAGLVGNFGLAAGSILGASMIVMSWYGVNFVLGVGLHSYGFGTGGQWYVIGFVMANWAFLAAAMARYLRETRGFA